MTATIHLIEDDLDLGRQIVDDLQAIGLSVEWSTDIIGFTPAALQGCELLILDLYLPSGSGLDVLRDIRADSTNAEIPVLVLTAQADPEHLTWAFKLGADDYLTKPFWPIELVERVKARLRRPSLSRDATIRVGKWLRIDGQNRRAWSGGSELELTRVEFDVLATLARRQGQAIARAALVSAALDPSRKGGERTLDVHVARLRKKLGETATIETVWGVGYRLGTETNSA